MILTVTINPLLERRFIYRETTSGKVNRNPLKEILTAGGKGINVSRQLNFFNIDNIALTFAGGTSGKVYKKLLADENVKTAFVQNEAETRNGTVIIDEKNNIITTYFGQESIISESESNEFLVRLEKMIANCEIVIFSGSSPSSVTDHIFPEGIKIANSLDKISFLDTYGKHLPECLKSIPTLVHNNMEELRLYRNVDEENSVFEYMDELYSMGIKQVYVTNGSSQTCASLFDFHYQIENPVIIEKDATGSGDAFMAGLIYGWHNNLTFEETSVFAACAGAANASVYPVCKVPLEDALKYKDRIKFSHVGKKMKIIDVTPR